MNTPESADTYPEHAKQARVLEASQAIGEFLDLGPYTLAEYQQFDGFREPQLVPVTKSIPQVLAQWFGIDLDAIEREKRLMIEQAQADAERQT